MKKKLLIGLAITGVMLACMGGLSEATTISSVGKITTVAKDITGTTEDNYELIGKSFSIAFSYDQTIFNENRIYDEIDIYHNEPIPPAAYTGDFNSTPFVAGGIGSFELQGGKLIYYYLWDATYDSSLEVSLDASGHGHFQIIFGPVMGFRPFPEMNLGIGAYNGIISPTPEPATLLLMGTGLAGLIGARRKKKA